MKKCAYCGRDNQDVAVACRECGKEFEASPTSETDPQLLDPALSPVVVARFSSLQQANLLAARLEAAGLEAFIPEEYAEQVFSSVIALERLTVRVAAKDYEAAKAIVAEGADATSTDVSPGPSESQTAARPEIAAAETREEENGELQGRKLCVSCGAVIPAAAHLCPKCGWTQPGNR